jgi:hypothetical protein
MTAVEYGEETPDDAARELCARLLLHERLNEALREVQAVDAEAASRKRSEMAKQ